MTRTVESIAARPYLRPLLAGGLITICLIASLVWIKDPLLQRAIIVAGIYLILSLTEVVPLYVPTLVLWALTPLLLLGFGDEFRLPSVLAWSANPVLALFLGGFALSVAASRYGIDRLIARLAVHLSRGSKLLLLVLTMVATATLSMWMSNIAAAAMMIAALSPLFAEVSRSNRFRRALLMGIAIGANFGGMATPIGTGPNAIAIAAVSPSRVITFTGWMIFALPLTLGLLLVSLVLLRLRFHVRGPINDLQEIRVRAPNFRARMVMLVFFLTVAAWLTEPFHKVPSAIVALITTAVLFGSGLLRSEDLSRIDWSTLLLIAGGIGLGNLLEQSGVVRAAAASMPWQEVPHVARLFTLCLASAFFSALMSNTASVTMLIPLAAGIDPAPSTAILIAIAASLGIPFSISTPPNAMVYGEGGVTFSDLAIPGIILMILGCVLVSLTGPFVLNLVGIP